MLPDPWQFSFGRRAFLDSLRQHRITDAQLKRLLRSAARDAALLVSRSIGNANLDAAVRRALWEQGRVAMAQVEAALWNDINVAIRLGVRDITSLVAAHQEALINLLGRSVGRDGHILLRGMEAAASASVETLRARLLGQYNLSPRIYRNQALMRGQVESVVNRGILLNNSAGEIAKDVSKFIRPDAPGGTSFNAMRLGRTELNNAFHKVSRETYRGQPWVESVKWELSGSHPVEDECDDLAGDDSYSLGSGVFPPEKAPSPPHPHCLCHLVPITVSREEFASKLSNGDYNDYLNSRGFQPI